MAPTAAPLRILVIDDDPVMREILDAVFSLEGHTVLTAPSGETALPLLSNPAAPIDVVLSDLHLPGLCGPDLAARLDQLCAPSTLMVGMSGTKPTAAERGLFQSFLQKPFTTGEFMEALAAAGAKRKHPAGEKEPGVPKREAKAVASVPAAGEPGSGGPVSVLNEDIFTRLAATLPAAQLRELYDLTLRDVGERLERMQASELAGDREAVRREAHAIKGGTGMVGATELHQLAAATEGGSPGNTPPLADFNAACARLQRMLDTRMH